MEVFKIVLDQFSKRLTASGKENRWNKDGEMVMYFGSSRSLSTLELVVGLSAIKASDKYKVMVVSIADRDELIHQIHIKDLPGDWRNFRAYSELQQIGSDWYTSQQSLVLKVPSAVIVNEYNYIINTTHPEFKKNVSLVRVEDYFWDGRLFGG